MTVGEVCDLAYVVLLEHLERQVLADRHVAAVLMAAGSKDIELPSLHEKQSQLDAALVEEPRTFSKVDREQMELLRALGVA